MGFGQSKPKIPHVVIVGGGYSGTALACILQKKDFCKTTLIDPRDALHHNLASARTVVEPKFAKNLFLPYNKFISNHVKQRVASIKKEKNIVTLQNGKKMSYDYLVIATGASQPFPYKLDDSKIGSGIDETKTFYQTFTEAMKKAHRVACLGGNIFACELAGEIKTDYPDKQVIIIHPDQQLVTTRLSKEIRQELHEKLERKDVDLMLDQNVTNADSLTLNEHAPNQVVKTSSGKEVEVDLVVPCPGYTPSTCMCKSALGGAMTEMGALKVDSALRVEGCQNVYAIGHANNVDEEKTFHASQRQAEFVADHVTAAIQGGEPKTYSPGGLHLIVTIGCYDGVGTLGDGKLLDDDECRERKSEDLYTKELFSQRNVDVNQRKDFC